MDVLYTCDNNYVWLMGISTISMFENNKEMQKLNVYLLGESISEENRKILSEIEDKYNRKIIVLDVPQLDIPEALISARWPFSAFTRLYSGELLPAELDKVLYLDCDTIIEENLSELEKWDVSDKVLWGSKDCIGKEYKKNIGLGADGLYVNAGVLLINLSKLRKISVKDRLSKYITKYQKYINYADQDVLNGTFHKVIGVLPPKFDLMTIVATYSYEDIQNLRKPTNYYSKEEIVEAQNHPAIIHYTTNMRMIRPWFLNTKHPLAREFRKYMEMSPWKDRELTEMYFTSKEAKIIGAVEKLPHRLAIKVLGFLHSNLKPKVIRYKSMKGYSHEDTCNWWNWIYRRTFHSRVKKKRT